MSTPWSRLGHRLSNFLQDVDDPVIGDWAIGQGTDAPDRELFRRLVRFFADAEVPVSVLEMGCGSGIELRGLIESGLGDAVVYRGYDFTSELIEVCRAKFPDARFEVRDLLTLDEPKTAQIVLARAVLEHVEDGKTGLRNLYRTCRDFTVISWFMRPTWNDRAVGIEMADGFIHHQYGMRELLTYIREALRPAEFYRFDFDHHLYPCSVWVLCKSPSRRGFAEIAHRYLASEEFERAVLPFRDLREQTLTEQEHRIDELEAANQWLGEHRERWERRALDAERRLLDRES